MAAAFPGDMDHAQFAIGLLAGLVLLSAWLRVPALANATIAVAALGIGYVLIEGGGVPALIALFGDGYQHLQKHETFFHGLLVGKFIAGLIKWQAHRGRQGSWL